MEANSPKGSLTKPVKSAKKEQKSGVKLSLPLKSETKEEDHAKNGQKGRARSKTTARSEDSLSNEADSQARGLEDDGAEAWRIFEEGVRIGRGEQSDKKRA